MPSRTKKIIIILILIVVLLVVLVLVSRLKEKVPQIVNTTPEPDSSEVELDTIINVVFDSAPEAKKLSLEIVPEFEFRQELYDQSLIVTPKQNLKEGTTYQVNLLFEKKSIFSWSFSTKLLSETEVMEEEIKMTKELYPLIDYLPLETDSYSLTYLKSMVLEATLKTGTETEAREKIEAWIESKGIEPSTHQIIFTPEP